ncbi:hypothetical protein IMG5_038290, partial [Ichthyophthirius multifiliis]
MSTALSQIKQSLQKAYHKFIQTNYNVYMPGREHLHKERKYIHIEIQKKFQDIESERKQQRLALIEYKKKTKKRYIEQQLAYIDQQKKIGKDNLYLSTDSQTLNIENEEEKENLMKQLQKINEELQQIQQTKNELSQIDQKIEELEPDYVLITGIKKSIVINQLTYYEYMSRTLHGFVMHPETQKAIEKVHYDIEQNIPVRRELLFEVCPELFEAEIDQLDKISKDRILSRRPRLDTVIYIFKYFNLYKFKNESSVIRVIEKYNKYGEKEEKLEPLEQIKADEYEMRDFVYNKCGEFMLKYIDHLAEKRAAGYATIALILQNIELKDENKLTTIEKQLKEDLLKLKQIQQDFDDFCELCKERAIQEQKKLFVPEFVKQNKILEQAWIEKWELLVGNSYEFSDSILVPEVEYEDQFDKVLKQQRKYDIQELINQSNEEQKRLIGGDEPIRQRDRNLKDTSLLQKLSVLTDVMHQLPEQDRKKLVSTFQGQIGGKQSPEEKKILLTEMTKVLFQIIKTQRNLMLIFGLLISIQNLKNLEIFLIIYHMRFLTLLIRKKLEKFIV